MLQHVWLHLSLRLSKMAPSPACIPVRQKREISREMHASLSVQFRHSAGSLTLIPLSKVSHTAHVRARALLG